MQVEEEDDDVPSAIISHMPGNGGSYEKQSLQYHYTA